MSADLVTHSSDRQTKTMKPPSTVEARVAEELRNWLSSELEQLDASNTNQFAHHVVTILLHEDLDIEDEPLSAGDDFLRDIYSIRKSKTRDKQKKAAVQFLSSAVCCNDPVEAEIQGVVDELMVKIEETKIKMKSKSSLKRVSVQVHNSLNQARFKHDSTETERLYNEAFPSLHPISTSSNSLVGHRPGRTGTDSSWHSTRSRQHAESGHSVVLFSSQEEADACLTARQVVVSALAENDWPSLEATEICSSLLKDNVFCDDSIHDTCTYWSIQSAFQTCTLLKRFVPKKCPLQSADQPDEKKNSLPEFSPIVIPVIQQSCLQTVHLDPSYEKTLSDHPQLFRPIKEPSAYFPSPMSDADKEVDSVFSSNHEKEQPLVIKSLDKGDSFATGTTFDGGGCDTMDWNRGLVGSPFLSEDTLEDDCLLTGSVLDLLRVMDVTPEKKTYIANEDACPRLTETSQAAFVSNHSPENNSGAKNTSQHHWRSLEVSMDTCTGELDEACSFPDHFGAFWKVLAETGSMALYPVVASEEVADLEGRFKSNHQTPEKLITKFVSKEDTELDCTEHLLEQGTASDFSVSELTRCEHSHDHCRPDVACGQWLLEQTCTQVQCFYSLQQLARVQWEHKSCLNQASLLHLLVPSFSSSYLSSQASQFLQLVNIPGVKCSDLENCWLSTETAVINGSFEQPQPELVPGCTCSSWLENNCHLGEKCPFSHPSV